MIHHVGIIGLGEYIPEKVLTNLDLEKMVDTSDEWIISRTGIKERHIAAANEATSDLGANAAKAALKDAGLKAQDIELLIVSTTTPDMQFPSTACFVQKKIGAINAACFDVSAACAGYLYAMAIAKEFIMSGSYKNALVIGAEKLSAITDWTDRNTCVLFGDGAGAAVLAPVKSAEIIFTYLGSDGRYTDLLNLPGGGSLCPTTHQTVDAKMHYLRMQGNEVFKIAVNMMTESYKKVVKLCGKELSDISWIIPHQANVRIISAAARKLEIPQAKIFMNIEKYGNMSSASCITLLCEAAKSGKFKKGDLILMVSFGAGMVWASSIIEW